MILSTLLYLSVSAFALPTPPPMPPGPPPGPPPDFSPSDFPRGPDIRCILSMGWNCLATIFACTWIAVHPNIPGPNDNWWAVLRRRIAIMGYVLIAPEMIIFWAARQHSAAKDIAERYQGRGWTMVHGFFIGMGGFILHDQQGTSLRVLEAEELEELVEAGKIAWPSITKKEIQDKSKGDYLSKGIVLVQTSWFILHCIAKGVYRIDVTELEVATLAFAAITGVTYYLWWDKPLDIRCSVPVHLLKLREDDENERVDTHRTSSSPTAANPPSISLPIPCETTEVLNSNHTHNTSHSPTCQESHIPPQTLVVSPDSEPKIREQNTCNLINTPSRDNSIVPQEPNSTGRQRFSAFIQRQRQEHGTFLGLVYVSPLYPLLAIFGAFSDMLRSDTLHSSSPLRVPTFYAPKFKHGACDRPSSLLAIWVAVAFGGIHCVAWSFHFPSLREQLGWRISAASASGVPILLMVSMLFFTACGNFFGGSTISGKFFHIVKLVTAFTLITTYVVARIALLILPCISLRAIPPGAFVEIPWTTFLPHIG